MIKPDGVQRGLVGEIVARLEQKGLELRALKLKNLDIETARKHYAEHREKPFTTTWFTTSLRAQLS